MLKFDQLILQCIQKSGCSRIKGKLCPFETEWVQGKALLRTLRAKVLGFMNEVYKEIKEKVYYLSQIESDKYVGSPRTKKSAPYLLAVVKIKIFWGLYRFSYVPKLVRYPRINISGPCDFKI